MLPYAEKLRTALTKIAEVDVLELKNSGFSNEAILEINAVAAYMNFVNRIADGLGFELEAGFEEFKR